MIGTCNQALCAGKGYFMMINSGIVVAVRMLCFGVGWNRLLTGLKDSFGESVFR